jgi:hypothetical protein
MTLGEGVLLVIFAVSAVHGIFTSSTFTVMVALGSGAVLGFILWTKGSNR